MESTLPAPSFNISACCEFTEEEQKSSIHSGKVVYSHEHEGVKQIPLCTGGKTTVLLGQREVRISKLENSLLQEFPLPGLTSVDSSARFARGGTSEASFVHFFYSNEFPSRTESRDKHHYFDFKNVLRALDDFQIETSDKLRVSVLVGESSLLAAAPLLARNCDVVLMTDYDHYLLNLQAERIKLISICKNEVEFKENLKSYMKSSLDKYQCNKDDLEEFHPFYSKERLEEVKLALKNLSLVPVCCNLFSANDIEKLSRILKDNQAEIVFLNLSNAMEYSSNFYHNNNFVFLDGRPVPYRHIKKYLPINREALCACSALFVRPKQINIATPEICWNWLDEKRRQHSMDCAEKNLNKKVSWIEAVNFHLNASCGNRKNVAKRRGEEWLKDLISSVTHSEVEQLSAKQPELNQTIHSATEITDKKKKELIRWISESIQYARKLCSQDEEN